MKSLPDEIERDRKGLSAYLEDIATRDANSEDDFSMVVGGRTYAGKDARANAGDALNEVAYSWRYDQSLQVRGSFRGLTY